jgi:hypothetical protein
MSAQVIKGKVLDKMNWNTEIVIATQSNTNTNTDFDGNFSVNAKVGEILKISMLGFDPITANATLDLMTTMMESQDTALKEVVIIGYGSRKG